MNCFYRQLYLLVIGDLVANFDSVDLYNYYVMNRELFDWVSFTI